jgi:glycosyltransferase involved in cell wall biosynthesis
MDRPTYSIVIPAYNEGERITAALDQVLAWIGEQRWSAELVVVNDGSRDNTAAIIARYAAAHPQVRLIENPGNHGKGYSVRNGMTHARGDLLLFTDADLSSPISEAPKLFDALAAGADVAIGSRWLRSELQTERQPFYRQLFGRVFNLFLRMMLGIQFKDTQCGFKAFRRSAADAIFPRQRIERWGFDAEILFLARRFGFKSIEIGVAWGHDERTKISYFRDGMRMVWEVLLVRWYALTGKYDQPLPVPQISEPSGPRGVPPPDGAGVSAPGSAAAGVADHSPATKVSR